MRTSLVTRVVSGQVVFDSTSNENLLVTDFVPCGGDASLSATGELRSILTGAGASAALRYRTASVSTKRPGQWSSAGTANTTEQQWSTTWSLGSTNAELFVQYGMVGKYTGGSASEALATLQGGVSANSAVVAVSRVQVEPTANSGTYVVQAVGKRFPLLGLTGVIYGIVFSGVSGTITFRPCFRSFQGNEDFPQDWTNLTVNQTQTADWS